MYIWIGCKLPEHFEQEIRQHCLMLNQQIGLNTVAFELPQHISLKISFNTDHPKEIQTYMSDFLAQQKPFSVRILNPEQAGNILWMPVEENEHLLQLHSQLDAELENRFGILQHEFDKCFKFHSTMFIDSNPEKISRMCNAVKDYPIARELTVDTFLLGESESGKPGTFRIVHSIKV